MRFVWLGLGLAVLLMVLGCDSKSDLYPVSGTVTFDGQPVKEGDIIFLDPDNKVSPDAGKIENGKFTMKAKKGSKKVDIRATKIEPYPKDKTGAMGEKEGPVDYIPEKYNLKTELTAEVNAKGENTYEFKLLSK